MDNYLNEYVNLIGGAKRKLKREIYVRPRILESYEEYKNSVLPIELKKNKQWVYDLFEGKKEKDKVLYQDEDFVLVPDIKWDGKNKWELRVVAFFKKEGLYSIRELTADNIDLLERVKEKSCEIIKKKFDLTEEQLKIYFHYRPTVWQLHMHFVCLFLKSPASSIERSHSVYSVIENMKIDPNYYQKVKIHCFNDN